MNIVFLSIGITTMVMAIMLFIAMLAIIKSSHNSHLDEFVIVCFPLCLFIASLMMIIMSSVKETLFPYALCSVGMAFMFFGVTVALTGGIAELVVEIKNSDNTYNKLFYRMFIPCAIIGIICVLFGVISWSCRLFITVDTSEYYIPIYIR